MKYRAMNANSERTTAITICVVSSMPGRREVPKYVTPMPRIRAPISNSTFVKAAIGKPSGYCAPGVGPLVTTITSSTDFTFL